MALTLSLPEGRRITCGGAVVTLGRVPGNDVVLADPRISSRHGRLIRQGEGYAYEDLGSRNGSLVEIGGELHVAHPQIATPVGPGDRLLLGDLVSPVVVQIESAPPASLTDEGATIIARRAVAGAAAGLGAVDTSSFQALFELLHALSGQTDAEAIIEQVVAAVLARFPRADSVSVLQRDAGGAWTVAHAAAGGDSPGVEPAASPSRRLIEEAARRHEGVLFVPGDAPPSASVAGLAGAALVPLLAGEEVIGALHVGSRRHAFGASDLAWLTVVGTHLAAGLAVARRFRLLSAENEHLRGTAQLPRPILGRSRALTRALDQLARVGRTGASVLILGETGTGKELAARAVHAHSPRADRPFAAVNCAALTEDLLNSELFGHRRGAFTGADRDRKGLFESADGGTVFLDEIGEISGAVQVALLRVLQEREVQPVGSTTPIKVDVRIIAATNRDLEAEASAGRFREDLYYRLAVFPVRLPPLREREGDVELLSERFREAACARHGVWVPGFTQAALAALRRYPWPGNVRQLEHEVERAVILATEGASIDLPDLSAGVRGAAEVPAGAVGVAGGGESKAETSALDEDGLAALLEGATGPLKEVMGALEERVIRRCLDEHDGNRTRAAEVLGISRQALQAKLARWRDRD